MAILSSVDTGRMVINTINSNVVVVNMPPTPVDVDANAVSKIVQLALGGIGVGNFSAGSAGAAYRNQLLAGSHSRTYKVAFFVILGIIYLTSVGQMLAAAHLVSLDGNSAKKITFVSFFQLLVLFVFCLVSYHLLHNQ